MFLSLVFARFNSNACKNCPSCYECKIPEKNDDNEKFMENLRASRVPSIFRCHKPSNPKKWRNLFLFVCLPVIIIQFVDTFFITCKETKRLKFKKYEHLRIRRKEFFWDPVRTLFHNPRMNALPDGYEVEVPESEEYEQ